MKNESPFIKIAKQNPHVFQYTKFCAGFPYITSFNHLGGRSAHFVTQDEITKTTEMSVKYNLPFLCYENGVYCWTNGPDEIYLFVEPDFAEALNQVGYKTHTNGYVPMTNGETYLGSPSLDTLRHLSHQHQRAKLGRNQNNQKTK